MVAPLSIGCAVGGVVGALCTAAALMAKSKDGEKRSLDDVDDLVEPEDRSNLDAQHFAKQSEMKEIFL